MGVTKQPLVARLLHPAQWRRYAGVIGLFWLAGGVAQGAPPGPTTVRDLYYRDILFQQYQQDYFGAITRLLAAQQLGRIERDRADTELLRLEMELSYGLHAKAPEALKRALAGNVDPGVRDRTWLALSKVWMRRGYPDRAADALSRMGDGLGKEERAERALLQAQLLMARNRNAEAAATLAGVQAPPPDWSAYLRYNQAVALQRSGEQAAGVAMLEELGRLKTTDQELLALRDKANLSLGFAYLGGGQAQEAKTALERVRLDSPFSTQALLGLGWAEYGLGNVSKALVSWTEARARGVTDAAAHEAAAMIPFAQWQLRAYRDALQKYHAAIAAYDSELARLDEVIAQIDAGTLIADLATVDDGVDPDMALARIAGTGAGPYLLPLLASDRFREPFTTYLNLRSQQRRLNAWMAGMSAGAATPAAGERLAALQLRIAGLQPRLGAAVQRHERYLLTLVHEELGRQKHELQTYRVEARYARARLLDEIATTTGGD